MTTTHSNVWEVLYMVVYNNIFQFMSMCRAYGLLLYNTNYISNYNFMHFFFNLSKIPMSWSIIPFSLCVGVVSLQVKPPQSILSKLCDARERPQGQVVNPLTSLELNGLTLHARGLCMSSMRAVKTSCLSANLPVQYHLIK